MWCASSCMTQNSVHLGDYWSNSRANFEEGQISAKSIAEHLGLSLERVGYIIPEDLDVWKLSAKWVSKCLNADPKRQGASGLSKFWNFFGAIQMISFQSRLLTMDETWLYHYDRRQSNNQWSGGIANHTTPKNSVCKNSLEKFRLDFLGSRWYVPQWLSSKGPNYQHEVLLISAGANEGYFVEKTPLESHQMGLVFHDCDQAQRALATRKKPLYLSFQCLDQPPCSPKLAPSDYHLFPGLKNKWKVAIFRPTRRS